MKTISKRYDKYYVVLYDKDDNYYKEYDSINCLANDLNFTLYYLYRTIRNNYKVIIDNKKYSLRLYSKC